MKNKYLKTSYDSNGFVIVKNVIDCDLIYELRKHVFWLIKKNPKIRPEALHHHLLINDPFIHHLTKQRKLLDAVGCIIGDDIALFGAHYIAKKPFSVPRKWFKL